MLCSLKLNLHFSINKLREQKNQFEKEVLQQSTQDITDLKHLQWSHIEGDRREDKELHEPFTMVVEDDRSSNMSFSGGSIFSLSSLTSTTATDLSRGDGYSTEQIEIATREVLSILQSDEVLVPLYITAVRSAFIGPHRFVRNFRRLLKLYSEHLKEDARDSLDYLAARLVAFKARYLADSILEKFGNDSNSQSLSPGRFARFDVDAEGEPEVNEDKSDGEDDLVSYEGIVEDLAKVRDFLTASDAFRTLRIQLQEFVTQSKSSTAKTLPVVPHKTIMSSS